MIENHTQRYLRSDMTLEDLQRDYDIRHSDAGDLVILNYHIKSPKTHPITMECRGLILEKETWNLVSKAFDRFFNLHEAQNLDTQIEFDFAAAYATEKIDGSLIQLFNYNGKWRMATRGVIDGDNRVPYSDHITFGQLFWSVFLCHNTSVMLNRPNLIYVFELISPLNRVITQYESDDLYLLTIRDREKDFQELDFRSPIFEEIVGSSQFKVPERHPINTFDDAQEALKKCATLDEGFVAVDYGSLKNGNFPRIKLKNQSYLNALKIKEGAARMSGLLGLIIADKTEEFAQFFPAFRSKLEFLREAWLDFVQEIAKDVSELISYFNAERTNENRKEFAQHAKTGRCPEILFMLYNKKARTINDCVRNMKKHKSEKIVHKKILQWMNVSNEFIFPDHELMKEEI